MPVMEEIKGEEFRKPAATVSSPTDVFTGPRPVPTYLDCQQATERGKALMAKGLGKRAVVCFTNSEATNPLTWGVVVEVNPFSSHPLEVRFVAEPWNRGIVRSNGDDLRVIYPCMNQTDLHAYIQSKKLIH